MNNTEKIVLRFPNDTYLDLSGDPEVIRQILKHLDGIEIHFKTQAGFFVDREDKNDN